MKAIPSFNHEKIIDLTIKKENDNDIVIANIDLTCDRDDRRENRKKKTSRIARRRDQVFLIDLEGLFSILYIFCLFFIIS